MPRLACARVKWSREGPERFDADDPEAHEFDGGREALFAKNKKPLGSKGGRNQGVRRAPTSGGGQKPRVAYTEKLSMSAGYHNI